MGNKQQSDGSHSSQVAKQYKAPKTGGKKPPKKVAIIIGAADYSQSKVKDYYEQP